MPARVKHIDYEEYRYNTKLEEIDTESLRIKKDYNLNKELNRVLCKANKIKYNQSMCPLFLEVNLCKINGQLHEFPNQLDKEEYKLTAEYIIYQKVKVGSLGRT
jgi:hypothetical protein